jgi:hypothetical protein
VGSNDRPRGCFFYYRAAAHGLERGRSAADRDCDSVPRNRVWYRSYGPVLSPTATIKLAPSLQRKCPPWRSAWDRRRPLPVTEGDKIAATKHPFAGWDKLTLTLARGVQLKDRFNSVAVLIAAIGCLVLVAHHYLTAPTSISDFTRRDFFYIFGVLFAFACIYRAASWLREGHKTFGAPRHVDVDPAVISATPTGNYQLSFGAALRKRAALLSIVLVFFFSLPLLFQLGAVRTQHGIDWHTVILGELLMAIAVLIGWFRAKRKFDKSLRR